MDVLLISLLYYQRKIRDEDKKVQGKSCVIKDNFDDLSKDIKIFLDKVETIILLRDVVTELNKKVSNLETELSQLRDEINKIKKT